MNRDTKHPIRGRTGWFGPARRSTAWNVAGHALETTAWLGLLAAACGTQYGDPIVAARGGATSTSPPPANDPCLQWTTEASCLADAAHGCSFQPNLVGCHADEPSCPAGTCGGGDPYVRRVAETLWLHGEPYSFLGAVSWSAAWSNQCKDRYPTHEESLLRTFNDLADMKASAFRIWAFQSYVSPSNNDYTSFERVIAYARRAGVRLIMVLENMQADCTETQKTDAWFAGGFRSRDGSNGLPYDKYVSNVVSRFKDEPTILAWELMHEARGNDFNALNTFAAEMSQLVRDSDPNHLIALGTDNGDSEATSRNNGDPSNYQLLHTHEPIGLFDVHDFNLEGTTQPTSVPEQLAIARRVLKATFNGATAVKLRDTTAAAFEERADTITGKLDATFAQEQMVGFLVYDYLPGWEAADWDFDGRAEEPLAGKDGVLAMHARPNH